MSEAAFAEAVEAAGRLPDEDLAALVGLLQRRLADQRRQGVAADVRDASAEFATGQCRSASPDDILRDALS
ncbi:MAG: hypothetical protein ACRC7O_09020 [Fimbriiglobus sp.]